MFIFAGFHFFFSETLANELVALSRLILSIAPTTELDSSWNDGYDDLALITTAVSCFLREICI
jgi:hypothetical protein